MSELFMSSLWWLALPVIAILLLFVWLALIAWRRTDYKVNFRGFGVDMQVEVAAADGSTQAAPEGSE